MSKLYLKPDPTLADIQQYVVDLVHERGFQNNTVLQEYLLLVEEVGELAKVIRKNHAGMRIDAQKTYDLDAAGEIADILILLCAVANHMGVNMEQAFRDKEAVNKQRAWR